MLADGVLVVVTAIWGASFVVVQDALRLADPFTFLVLRFTLAAALLTALDWRGLLDRRILVSGGALGALLFVGFITQTAGLQFTTPSRSGFLTGLSVLLVPFVKEVYPGLDAEDQARFRKLLECEDQDMFGWFMQRGEPGDPDLRHMVRMILDRVQPK